MTDTDRLDTHGRARLSFASEADIDEFVEALSRFERGEMSPADWRAFRLVRGTYGQRQPEDAQMIRVKVPQGILDADALRAIAETAERWSRGFAHLTTRQNVQFHFVRLRDVERAMRHLAAAGLTTREACGNAVRNVTACVLAGVSPDEVFDVTPYAEALTRHFLRHPLAAALPRKFKTAFEGCAADHARAAINDIGWRARLVDGRRGFRVFVGGGTSTMPTSGRVLEDFVPASDVLTLAEAILRVYHERGDYQHKARNRMKFLIKSLGWDRFRAAVLGERDRLMAAGGAPLPFDVDRPPVETAPSWTPAPAPDPFVIARVVDEACFVGPGLRPEAAVLLPPASRRGFDAWRTTNVVKQRQAGYAVATATVPLGDLSGAQLRVVARLAQAYGDGTVRLTVAQNLVFRWVPELRVQDLYVRLAAAGLGRPGAGTIADVTSCPGAESCKLAVTQSRGLGHAIGLHVRTRPDLVAQTPGLDVKISGCPNGCGQHHIAAIGFQGSLRKVDGRPAPQYFVYAGGGVQGDGAVFGRLIAKVPARRAPEALERLARLYAGERRPDESPTAFFGRVEVGRLQALVADLEHLTSESARPDDFIDYAETGPFRPDTQDGECAV